MPKENKNDSKAIIKLKTPFQLNGTNYTELELDFDSLSAQQQIEADRMYRTIYKDQDPMPVSAADPRFQLILAGMAAKVNHEDLLVHLKGKDYRTVVNRALNFCGDTD